MKHRHIDSTVWSRAALFSLMERGSLNDLLNFMEELKASPDEKVVEDFLFVSDRLGNCNFARTMLNFFNINFKSN